MRDDDVTYRIAVSMTPGVTPELVFRMEEAGVSPEEFICLPTEEIRKRLKISGGAGKFQQADRDAALFRARQETEFVCRHNIRTFYLSDPDYPFSLAQIPDAPLLIYVLGNPDFDSQHTISIVGTRRCTVYGRNFVSQTVKDLAGYFPDLAVVSGLAYGIDEEAHKASLEAGVRTVAVVAHGLHTIYPAQHTELARAIVKEGGCIVTEYPGGTPPFRGHFLARNRIIAGMSPITIVAESEIKGGAMSTAARANNYDRQVMALPGRTCDTMSGGCNSLIRRNMASLVERAADIVEIMGWQPQGLNLKAEQRNLFPELEGDVKKIYDTLRFEGKSLNPDAIHYHTGLPIRRIMELLPDMEFDGIVARGPGNVYSLI